MATVLTIIKLIVSVIIAWLGVKSSNSSDDAVAREQKAKDDALQQKFDQIDAAKPDLDIALKRLHDRAGTKPPDASAKAGKPGSS